MASFESTLASIPGYGGYLAKRKMNEDDGTSDMQKLSALMTLSEMAQKQKQTAVARDSTANYLSSLGAGPDAEAMRAYGQVDPSGLLEKVIKQKMDQAQSDKEFARFGLGQPTIQSPAPQMLTGNEPMAAKSGDMAGLSGFQGNPQALLEQINKTNASPQDKQMMLSQLQEQMKGASINGASPETGASPALPPALANISRDQAILMSGSQDKGVAAIGKMVSSHYEKRDMLDLQGQQRADMLRLAAGLKPEAGAAPISQIRVIDNDPNSPTYGKPVIKDGRTGRTLGLDSGLDVGAQGAFAGAKTSGQVNAKLIAGLPQARLRTESIKQNLDKLDAAMTTLHDDPNLGRITGTLAGRTWNITNEATSVQTDLNSIKSQIFQSSLQSMREASKTGGAVGNVSDREGDKLERTLAGLDQSAGTPKFKENLKKAIAQVRLSKELIQNAFDEQYGSIDPPAGSTPSPSTPAVTKSGATVSNW